MGLEKVSVLSGEGSNTVQVQQFLPEWPECQGDRVKDFADVPYSCYSNFNE